MHGRAQSQESTVVENCWRLLGEEPQAVAHSANPISVVGQLGGRNALVLDDDEVLNKPLCQLSEAGLAEQALVEQVHEARHAVAQGSTLREEPLLLPKLRAPLRQSKPFPQQ